MKVLPPIILLFMFYLPTLQAQEIIVVDDNKNHLTLQVTTNYMLGDNDSLIDARTIALQQSKQKLAEKAGSYIHAEKVIENNRIKTDTISTISTALMSVDITDESISVISGNKTQLTLTTTAKIDKQSLYKKLVSLKDSKEKQQKIKTLEQENQALLKKLNNLNTTLRDAGSLAGQNQKNLNLINQRNEVIFKINKNESSIRKTFEPGTLLSIANKYNNAFESAKEDINTNVFNYIKNNTHIRLGDPNVIDNNNGTYDILYPIYWEIDAARIREVLQKHFNIENNGDLNVIRNMNVNTKEKPFSEKLFDFYNNKYVYIEITTGNYTNNRMIMGSTYAMFNEYTFQNSNAQYFRPSNRPSRDIDDILIKNVLKKDLPSMETIKAKVIISNKTEKMFNSSREKTIYIKRQTERYNELLN
jgi:cell division protein FtsB